MKLIVKDLEVVRGEDLIFTDLTFEVASGEALVVTGPNGVGKSTLLRALCGLLPANSGTIAHEDPSGEFEAASLSALCHYLGPDNAMKPALSVEENLHFWQEYAGQPHLSVFDALGMVGLDHLGPIPFSHLSTGQKRRVAIARLLVSYRPVWLLDEPTSGLDAASEAQFCDLMNVHLEEGGLIVAATHVPLNLSRSKVLRLEPVDPSLDGEGARS